MFTYCNFKKPNSVSGQEFYEAIKNPLIKNIKFLIHDWANKF